MNSATCFAEIASERRSIRRFLPTPVPRELILELLDLAARAPSGVNTQPWQVHVLTGAAKARLTAALLKEYETPTFEHQGEYDYYPAEWVEPYLSRRRATGQGLYALLGIEKKDRERMHTQWGRNFEFFDAPVGLVFTLDKCMGQGSFIDYGAFLQTLMLAARSRGLESCVQAALNDYHPVIHRELAIPNSQLIIAAMSFGYADSDAPENQIDLPRVPASEFTRFHE